jgi:AraC family transcriptional regulator
LASPRARSSKVSETADFLGTLAYYPPGLEQAAHEHDQSQASVLLVGSLRETVDGREVEVAAPCFCRKPEGTVHSNRFGPQGALVLSFHFKQAAEQRELIVERGWGWMRMSPQEVAAAVAPAGLRAGSGLFHKEAAADPDPAPHWLRVVRTRMEAEPAGASIAGFAAAAGVHRVHLSRRFLRCYGLSPSAFRRRQMTAVAMERIFEGGLPPAMAAQEAGFADQSHMLRTFRSVTGGLTPGHISRLLA